MEKRTDFAKGLSIGIIMDGNGRWAKKRGLPRTAGHKKGAEVFKDIFDGELGATRGRSKYHHEVVWRISYRCLRLSKGK